MPRGRRARSAQAGHFVMAASPSGMAGTAFRAGGNVLAAQARSAYPPSAKR